MSGRVALDKLRALAQPDKLKDVIADFNSGNREGDKPADITSCYVTAVAVVKTLTNQPIVRGVTAGQVTGMKPLVCQGQSNVQTSEILKHIGNKKVVMISLQFKKETSGGGDHHFVVFELEPGTIVAAMAWQNKYDLTQWFNENDQGKYPREGFTTLMKKIEGGSGEAVADLCSFLGHAKDGQTVIASIRNEVLGYKAKSTGYVLDLPDH